MAIGSEVVNYGLKWLVHDVMQDVSMKFPTPISVMTLISDMNSSEKWPRRNISCDNSRVGLQFSCQVLQLRSECLPASHSISSTLTQPLNFPLHSTFTCSYLATKRDPLNGCASGQSTISGTKQDSPLDNCALVNVNSINSARLRDGMNENCLRHCLR